jgi:hypothetical protein
MAALGRQSGSIMPVFGMRDACAAAHEQAKLASMGKTATYVLDLLVELLGPCEREKCFDWARGDLSPRTKRSKKLPFDGVWEARKLIIEIDEDQHREATPFFDKPQKVTVSGVHRGQQRALYDARKRSAAKKNGYVVISVAWPRKKKRRPVEDLADLKKRLAAAGITPASTRE